MQGVARTPNIAHGKSGCSQSILQGSHEGSSTATRPGEVSARASSLLPTTFPGMVQSHHIVGKDWHGRELGFLDHFLYHYYFSTLQPFALSL
jgi:hypothetical protein